MFSLYRSRRGLIAGVAAGVADRFGINRNLVRIAWIISVPFTMFGSAVLYAAAAILLPVAREGDEPATEAGPRAGFGREAFALFVGAHGLVHLIGFLTAWRLPVPAGFVYSTSAFYGRIELGDAGVKILGVVWLAVAIAYVLAAVLLWTGARRASLAAIGVSAVSVPLCALFSPEAVAGLVIDLALIAGLVAWPRVAPRLAPRPAPRLS